MNRVLVIGSGGAGKSTFATRLSTRTQLPLIHLDALYWKPGWIEPSKQEWSATVSALLKEPRWIMDGNYGGTLAERIEASDMIIFLDLPRLVCLRRAIGRWLRHRGRSRPDMCPGCPERLSGGFLWWIWTYPSQKKPAVLTRLKLVRGNTHVVVLSSQSQMDAFLESLPLILAE